MEERAVTCAIVRSDGASVTRIVCSWSAKTETPVREEVSKPVFEAVMVYVSGASDRKPKRPAASVVTVAVCDALTARMVTPDTGALVVLTTRPVIAPVVPARAQSVLEKTPHASTRTRIDRLCECSIHERSLMT
jgi:hypothetical protein